jgi:spermidine synthase
LDAFIEQKDDGALRLHINNDLQFDSRDERIYHEALALPALSAALNRTGGALRALIVGGGDGLTARELLKSQRLQSIDLVDYDARILDLARTQFATINCHSLDDPRMNVHVRDAWGFVEDALKNGEHYDLIVSDLTVPEDLDGARFHTVEWYQKLSALSGERGVLAINSCSPQATPRAFWSIFNGLIKASLQPRPCHVRIPSFVEMGYGDDWGFILASRTNIESKEVSDEFSCIAPRYALASAADLQEIFMFPKETFRFQVDAVPAALGSDVLLGYFYNDQPLQYRSQECFDAFAIDLTSLRSPDPDAGTAILPVYANRSLMGKLLAQPGSGVGEPVNIDRLLSDVVEMVPAIYKDQSPEIVADFLHDPAAFLRGVDLCALVSMLLQRAKQLPVRLVAELHDLRTKLSNWTGESLDVFQFSHRVLALLTLAVVLGNLLYPDMVYAKGHADVSRGHAAARGRGGVVNGGGYGYTNTYWNNRPIKRGPIGPGPGSAGMRDIQKGSGTSSGSRAPQLNALPDGETPGPEKQRQNQRLRDRLASEMRNAESYLAVLQHELSGYKSSEDASVIFGTQEISRDDAIRRTQLLVSDAARSLDELKRQAALQESDSQDDRTT